MPGEVVAGFFFEDQRPVEGPSALLDWRLNGLLHKLLLAGSATGQLGENILVGNNGKLEASWILFVGGGRLQDLAPFTYGGLVSSVVDDCRRAGFNQISLCLTAPADAAPDWVEQLARELALGSGDMEILLTLQEGVGA
ncbi:M17 family peptidase N-terminal domain-containing protein [Syntrophotalea acetylenivorans]|nr:M17 family peptidase N-terminal domain-containing protein [Syntrophotalea acetylenivorans]